MKLSTLTRLCLFLPLLGSVGLFGARSAVAQTALVHPGVLHRTEDLDRMRTMVAARTEPYLTGWNRLRTDPRAQVGYTPHPNAILQRIPDTVSYDALNSDAKAAHYTIIEFVVTGDAAYARKSVEILNAWSSTLTTLPSTGDPVLAGGLTAYHLAAAAEVVRATFPGWAAADQDRLRTLLLTRFYPIFHNFLLYHEPDGLPHTNTGVNQHFFASWDAIAMASMAAIGVFSDDRAKYQEALDAFKTGTGNGNIMRAVFDGATGQLQESGRDPEHAELGIGMLGTLCEIAWNQGDDLYGYADNRLLKGFEYTASYLLANTVPYRTYTDPFRTDAVISAESTAAQIAQARANPRPIFEMVWNHYVNRRGLPAPFTKQVADKIRPEGYNGDHIGFGTLLFTRPSGGVVTGDGGAAGASGGADASAGGAGAPGAGTGGRTGTGGAPGTGAGGVAGVGGVAGAGGAAGSSGSGGAATASGAGGGPGPGAVPTNLSGGCACDVRGGGVSDQRIHLILLALSALLAAVGRRRSPRRVRSSPD